MRQKPKLQDKKLKAVLKSRVSAPGRANVDTTKRKRAKIASSRLATCRSKLKGQDIKPQRRQKRMRDQTASIAKGMAELHLPFLTPTERHSLSTAEIVAKLGWSTVELPLRENEAWGNTGLSSDRETEPLQCPEDKPNWNTPPKVPPDQAVRAYVHHLNRIWGQESRLQLPANWPVFCSVDWDQKQLFTLGTTDSSESPVRNRSSTSLNCERASAELKLPHEAAIHCHLRSIQQPRVRTQWQLMQSMRPSWFKWRYQTEVRAKRRHSRRHAGSVDYNQASLNQDLWPQVAIAAFLHPLRPRTVGWSMPVDWLGEIHSSSDIGRLIVNIVSTDAFPPQSQVSLKWPPCLSPGIQSPTINYTCQATDISFGLHQPFRPLLFAAQYRGKPQEQLAIAFQPMMTLFILYYLDTRTSLVEPMPPWMVLFGAVYNQDGFYVQAFFPSFRPLPNEAGNGEGWGAQSVLISYNHTGTMTNPSWHRGWPIQLLYRIQGHCEHVLEHLHDWDGYEHACMRLSIDSSQK